MASDKVVSAFTDDLKRLVGVIESTLSGLILCMVFQKKPSYGTDSWILCVCADGLDELTEIAALSLVLRLLDETCSKETVSQVERVSIPHAYDPQLEELLVDIDSVADGKLLVGRSVFGRKIGRAQILYLQKQETASPVPARLRA